MGSKEDLSAHAVFGGSSFSATKNEVEFSVMVGDATQGKLRPKNTLGFVFSRPASNTDFWAVRMSMPIKVDGVGFLSSGTLLSADMTPQDCLEWARQQYKNLPLGDGE